MCLLLKCRTYLIKHHTCVYVYVERNEKFYTNLLVCTFIRPLNSLWDVILQAQCKSLIKKLITKIKKN